MSQIEAQSQIRKLNKSTVSIQGPIKKQNIRMRQNETERDKMKSTYISANVNNQIFSKNYSQIQ